MFHFAQLLLRKDLSLIFRKGSPLCQAILLGLLLIFIFSMSGNAGEAVSPSEAASIFWLGSAFCQILLFNQLYEIEESNQTRENLTLSPLPIQGVWLGKGLAAFLLLALSQLVFFPAIIVFLGQNIVGSMLECVKIIIACDLGICALGSLMGACAQGQTGRESLLSVFLFPLLIPLLLGGISLLGPVLGAAHSGQTLEWFGLILAFDAIFTAAALLLFPFLYQVND